MTSSKLFNITQALAQKLVFEQFPEFSHLPISEVYKQGHDNRTYRLGEHMLIRMPSAESYALKVPKEQKLLPRLRPHLTTAIPIPLKMGMPTNYYPFKFSIYHWLEGKSANNISFDEKNLESIAIDLAQFLNELRSIDSSWGPTPGLHNWYRGDHIKVYDKDARNQIAKLSGLIDSVKALTLWEKALNTKWHSSPVWIHGDFASGNVIVKDNKLVGVIDFGGMGVGDPACDLVITWTFLKGKSREIFQKAIRLNADTWLRAKAWALWKATYELCNIKDVQTHEVLGQKQIIADVLLDII